ncbi:MAG: flavin reductase [Clostridiales bacterium]|nr:flavin reductase [Clostridiales bacterium]
MEKTAMYQLTYGLFVLTTTDGAKQNGCIVNTVSMLTDNPKRITVFVNKANYSEELLRKTGVCNVSILTEKTPFDIFRQFGFQSGRDVDKFAGGSYPTTENGLYYLPEYANAVISAKVIDAYEYDTHTLFVAEVTEAVNLSNEPSVTYAYYQSNIKPKPQTAPTEAEKPADGEKKQGKWVCKICGYTHEGEELPEDFICPWCKHPAEDFERIA